MLSKKYLKDNSILETPSRYGSPIWNSIVKARDALRDGYGFRVGNGDSSFWYSPWPTPTPICYQIFAVDIHDANNRIRDVYDSAGWHLDRLVTSLSDQLGHLITNTKLFLNDQVQDGFIWKGNLDGIYSAKEGYKWLSKKHRIEGGTLD